MANYVRFRRKGGTYFFTVNLAQRGSTVLTDRVDLLRDACATVKEDMPFRIDAMTILPDHLHAVWTLPSGDSDYSTRWKRVKREFTVNLGFSRPSSRSQWAKGEAGLWQRRFWEHTVRDEADLQRCLIYTWINPVKHGLVRRSVDWPFTSMHREIRKGMLPIEGL